MCHSLEFKTSVFRQVGKAILTLTSLFLIFLPFLNSIHSNDINSNTSMGIDVQMIGHTLKINRLTCIGVQW